jgi:hypothetical protein
MNTYRFVNYFDPKIIFLMLLIAFVSVVEPVRWKKSFAIEKSRVVDPD